MRRHSTSKGRKTGQVWSLDFIIGVMLFIFIILFAAKILLEMNISEGNTDVYREAAQLSEDILSNGRPPAWNDTSVLIPGIITNNSIDENKLAYLQSMNYSRVKSLFGISGEYIFYFHNGTDIQNFSQCIYGYPVPVNTSCEPDFTNMTYSDISRIDRVVQKNFIPYKVIFLVWN